ncbi:Hypothetical protein PHPALM_20192 [Phytophthora palmivora]|uniref:Uncharacterized protein n=1 Tax=Phytophthora palmivora TaxID=4796 RepID=A0A2P4XFH5_9STRA|nr:Hypothetical protein PHPALM_20192 [Phytophthora palmivora]
MMSAVNPGTVHRKAAKKPRTTYAPASTINWSSGSHEFCDDSIPATSQATGASHSAAALGRPTPYGSGALRSDQGGREELSHAFEYDAPSQPHPSGPSTSGRDSVGSLLSDEVRQLRDRVYAIEVALGLGPGGQAAAHAGKPWGLEVVRQDVDALGRETRELHGRVDRRVLASALKELRRSLNALAYETHGQMPSYEPTGYSYHWTYGYRGKILRTIIPFKTPHVIRWEVDGIGGAVTAEDPNGSSEAMLQLITPNGANQR